MIIPRTSLLLIVALLVTPLAVVAGTASVTATAAWLVILLVGLLTLVDGFLVLNRLDGLAVSYPAVTRLSKDQPGEVELFFNSEARSYAGLDVGIPLPPEIETPWDLHTVAVPEPGKPFLLKWPCTPNRRGCYRLDAAYVQCRSPLGLWHFRRRMDAHTELRVYPNLRAERQKTAAFFLPQSGVGIKTLRMMGKGRDFEKLRDYLPGDPYEDIHWKATAKHGMPMTKTYQVERTQEVYVLVDTSRLSGRRQQVEHGEAEVSESVLERFVASALVLGMAAEQQGDSFGMITFDNKVHRFVKAGGGKAHFNACRDALYTVMPNALNPDFENLFTFIRNRLRKRALLVILTSLDDPVLAESFTRGAELVCRQHLVVVNMMKPRGAQPLFADAGDVRGIDDVYRHLSGHTTWHKLVELKKGLARLGVHFEQLDQSGLSASLLTQYMEIKQKQLI